MADEKEGQFMVAGGAVIESLDGESVLLVKRSSKADISSGDWELVTGRLKQGETLKEGIVREVLEETGLAVKVLFPLKTFRIFRGRERKEVIGVTFFCKADSNKVALDKNEN